MERYKPLHFANPTNRLYNKILVECFQSVVTLALKVQLVQDLWKRNLHGQSYWWSISSSMVPAALIKSYSTRASTSDFTHKPARRPQARTYMRADTVVVRRTASFHKGMKSECAGEIGVNLSAAEHLTHKCWSELLWRHKLNRSEHFIRNIHHDVLCFRSIAFSLFKLRLTDVLQLLFGKSN